jgi:hypothetical protein
MNYSCLLSATAASICFLLSACAINKPTRTTHIQSTSIQVAPASTPPQKPTAEAVGKTPPPIVRKVDRVSKTPPVAPSAPRLAPKPPTPEITELVETETMTVLETTTAPVSDQDLNRKGANE